MLGNRSFLGQEIMAKARGPCKGRGVHAEGQLVHLPVPLHNYLGMRRSRGDGNLSKRQGRRQGCGKEGHGGDATDQVLTQRGDVDRGVAQRTATSLPWKGHWAAVSNIPRAKGSLEKAACTSPGEMRQQAATCWIKLRRRGP